MLRKKTILTVCVSALTIAGNAHAGFDDFESFTLGQSVNGQGQWTVEDSFGNSAELFDESIVDDGSGNQVWQFSNAVTNGSYSNQPFSSKSAQVAGESGAQLYNDYGLNHTLPNNPPLASAPATNNLFYGAWEFKSATGAPQADLSLTVSPGASQSTLRMSYLRMDDTGSGFDLFFYDTTGTTFNGPTPIATGLNYSDWHKIEMYIEFVDGIGPGAVGSELGKRYREGLPRWQPDPYRHDLESYFYNVADSGPAGSPRGVDSLLFRMAGTANAANTGAGSTLIMSRPAMSPNPPASR